MSFTTEPKIEYRSELPYAGIRTQIRHQEMGSGIIPQLHNEIMTWLGQQEVQPAGPPFMRYYVINMDDKLDIELGWPIDKQLAGNGRIQTNVLPAGRYASLIYTGIEKGIEGNGVLIQWAEANGLAWDRWDDPNGDAFACRVEFYLTEPDDEPDMSKWETEVAIKLADE
jgi:effector-binding domain-containing protein